MTETAITDLNFDISKCMLDPFIGTLKFTVEKKIRIVNFEFGTHQIACRRSVGEDVVKYGLKLKLNGRFLFLYHKTDVDVEVNEQLILSPGNTYTLETWVTGHPKLRPGQVERCCYYHYAQVDRSDDMDYKPFDFLFEDNKKENTEPSNKTCIYSISYEIVD